MDRTEQELSGKYGNTFPEYSKWPNLFKYVEDIPKDLIAGEDIDGTHITLTLTRKDYVFIIMTEKSTAAATGQIRNWMCYCAVRNGNGVWIPRYNIDDEMKDEFPELRVCEIMPQGREVVLMAADEAEATEQQTRFLDRLNNLMPKLKIEWISEQIDELDEKRKTKTDNEAAFDVTELPF